MYRTHLRKIRRDIVARPTRTLLVTISVFIGVLGVVVLTTMGQLLTHQLEQDIKPKELAMLRVYLTAPSERVDNEAVFTTLRDSPGVTDVEGQAVFQFEWKLPDEDEWQEGQLFAYSEAFEEIQLEPLRLMAGNYPIAGQHQIAIEQRMANKHNLQVGDSLIVQNNVTAREEEWRIVGFVFQPYIYFGSSTPTSSVYAAYVDAQAIIGFEGYSSIYARFKTFPNAQQNSPEFRTRLEEQTPYDIVFHLIDDPQENTFLVGVQRFSRVLLIIAVVAMLVASFLVTNVISTIIAEQRRQIGAIKAIGATTADILIIYLGMAFVYGLIGTLPAVLLGNFLGQVAAKEVAPIANTILEDTSASPLALGLGAVLGLGIPVLAALFPVYHGAKVTIREAMSDMGIEATYGRGWLARGFSRLPLATSIHQAGSNILKHQARLSLTIVSLTLATAAFMGMFAVFVSLGNVINNIRDQLDFAIDPTQIQIASVVQDLITSDQEAIRTIQPGVSVEVEIPLTPEELASDEEPAPEPQTLFVTGVDTATDLDYLPLTDGTGWDDNPNRQGLVLTPFLAEQFGKVVGDTLQLASGEKTADFEVIGIATFPIDTAFMEWQQLADFVGVIRDAPVPNAYWDTVQTEDEENPLHERDLWALGIDERVGTLLTPDFNIAEPGVIITQALATAGGFAKGDVMTLKTGVNETEYPILEVVTIQRAQLLLMASDLPPDVLAQPGDPQMIALYWEALATLEGLDYRKVSPSTEYIDLANPQTETISTPTTITAPNPVYNNQLAFADRIAQAILSVGVVMNLASLLMALVGAIGLLTITSIGVFERQREIGVMRSVGASSRHILSQFLLEGILVGLVAWLIGVPLSYFLSTILIKTVPFQEVIHFSYTPLAPLLGLLGTLFISAAATLYPSLIAARKTVSEILRYQ